MKILRYAIFYIAIITSPLHAFDLLGISFVSPRSQSTDAPRDLVGWHDLINVCPQPFYGATAFTPSYGQSSRERNLAEIMFNTCQIEISGSAVPDRGANDILADYFGLSPSFESTVLLEPRIATFQFDMAAYFGWGPFYFRAHAPLVWTQWQLKMKETIANNGTDMVFPADYMAENPLAAPAISFKQAVKNYVTYGDVTRGLLFGRFGRPQTALALSDVQAALGWNFLNGRLGYLGMNLRASAPTGTRPNGRFLFEPVVGNGKHWEFGVGLEGDMLLWEKDGEQELYMFTVINAMHLFNARQQRSFDFIPNGFGSRYILVKEFDENLNFTGNVQPAINISTLCCDVSMNLQLDIVFMFGYTYNDFVLDIGYNIWLRTKEIIKLKQCIPDNRYGFKGIQDVTTFAGDNSVTTQSGATLHGDPLIDQAFVVDGNSPVFIKTQNIDLLSAASPLSLTQKIFGHIGYEAQTSCKGLAPFIGLGGDIEFEGINRRGVYKPDKNTISQWKVWLKGGFGF